MSRWLFRERELREEERKRRTMFIDKRKAVVSIVIGRKLTLHDDFENCGQFGHAGSRLMPFFRIIPHERGRRITILISD